MRRATARWAGNRRAALRGARDRGAASLDYIGSLVVAGIVVAAVVVAFVTVTPSIGGHVRYALCQMLSFGQGDCVPPAAAERVPSTPCVVNSDSVAMNQKVAVVVVTLEDGRTFEKAQMSDGTWRLTQRNSGGVGAEVGVGAGVSLTVNDWNFGGNVSADAGVGLTFAEGQVWYADTAAEADRIIAEEAEDTIEDTVAGDGGPVRWLWERGQDAVGGITGNGDYEFPPPDETYAEGGVVLNASAQAVGLQTNGTASLAASEVLGVRTGQDGRTTVYLRTNAEGEAGLQQLGVDTSGLRFDTAALGGKTTLVTAVTFDRDGSMSEVSTTATAAGESKGIASAMFGGELDPSVDNTINNAIIYRASLPIRSDDDRNTALAFLAASGVNQLGGPNVALPVTMPAGILATDRFLRAARDHGDVTQQSMERDTTTVFGYDASGKYVVELGAEGSVKTESLRTTEANYWDGTGWRAWEACG